MIAGQETELGRDVREMSKFGNGREAREDGAARTLEPLPFWAELERVYRRITRGDERSTDTERITPIAALSGLPERWDPVPKLREVFGLSEFEMDILLLCAGAALDRRFGAALAAMQPDSPAPTFGLAASMLEKPHWSAVSRMRPLRYWRLIEMGPGMLLQAPLGIDERILQYLLGVPAADERLETVIHVLTGGEDQLDAWGAALDETAARGALHWRRGSPGAILLTGGRASARTALFRAMCGAAGLHAWVLDAGDLPETVAERERLARAYTREAALWPAALLVRTERLENAALLEAWLCRVSAPVAVEVQDGSAAERLKGLRLAAPTMSAGGRRTEWQRRLGPLAMGLDPALDRMVDAFALDAAEIRETAEAIEEEAALEPAVAADASALGAAAWRLCRVAARRSLDELALRVENSAAWADLVLPEAQAGILRQIAVHARHAAVVHEEWGFAARYLRGLGLSALFAGPSGTGKTMAAGVLARELDRDLYQIDLATVVSKYIGETEKHLRKIFDAAERSGAILLFDEADALFGKRSQVRDSHDRYANLEVSYLLQRMESYRGIAILTTNMQNALDPAFQRRLRFVVQFPFPDAPSRERIWRRVFPSAAPTAALDYERLSQLNVTGGSIRNIALLAAFLAADAGTPIGMGNVLEAARTEYAKLDKPLSPAETRGWE
jgi:ATPase family associated with various cellular activities (AAA)/Winged helix domain, variant